MKVQRAQLLRADGGLHPAHQPADLRRVGIAGGVGKAQLLRSRRDRAFGQPQHLVLGNRAFHRAAESGGEADGEADAVLARDRGDGGDLLEHRGVILAHVLQAVRLGHREGDAHRVDARFRRVLGPFGVGHQCDHGKPFDPARERHQLGRVGHLGQQLRRNEAADLDLAHPGRRLSGDPAFLGLGRHRAFDRLQSVAQADFGYEDGGHAAFSR